MTKMHIFVATHKNIGYNIPFPHVLIGMDGYNSNGAIDISSFLPEYMNSDRTFASYRAGWGALRFLENNQCKDDDFMVVCSYRSFWGVKSHNNYMDLFHENTSSNQLDPLAFRVFQTPIELQETWKSSILLTAPEGVDFITTRPVDFGISVLEQYASSHHLDDLMYGIGLAIRLGCIDPGVTAHVLSNRIFIHGFAGRVKIFRELYSKLFLIAEEFYQKHHIPRDSYQERSINFVLERIVSIFLVQKIYYEKASALNVNLVQISGDGAYVRGS